MKIIDLLNKIANGEEVPRTIRWFDKFYNDYDEISNNYKVYIYEKLKNNVWGLNDEVEIIEEPKKIEKLELESGEIDDKEFLAKYITHNRYKINELIDEINKLKEEK